jgi:UDP-N-acetylmuramate dehydrogenase
MTAAECVIGYRDSLFKHGLADRRLILSVTFALPKRWQPVEGYADVARELKEPAMAREVQDKVAEAFGVWLEPEPVIV